MAQSTLKNRVREDFLSKYSSVLFRGAGSKEEISGVVRNILERILSQPRNPLKDKERALIIDELVDEFAGLGPVEKLMMDPDVTEVMINGTHNVYVEKFGKKQLTGIKFDSDQQLMYVIQKILSPTRRRVDESVPYTDISLQDGSRVNIIIPPLALDGPTITIRKFLRSIARAEDLIDLGTLDKRMADFLVACIKAKANIIFAGATGSGKTTTVGVLSGYINNDERVITIEDTAELHLTQDHVVRLETKMPNIEGKGEITIRDLFRNTLRMRPQRIILGEIRGAEALDMLQAMCSGHSGALSVIHADTPRDVLHRLETMILMSGIPITLEAIHRQIASSLHLIIQQDQLADGGRKITRISQVNGLKDGWANLEDIFYYDIEGLNPDGKIRGRFRATGILPAFYQIFIKRGIALAEEIFNKD
ncbi:MAG: CpaF family protein [Candidatus Omnitrophica bacterium]|jgi:pilus assembly protein CpaF|nr:CpaF family protein [Candidatus Omnitrophota bacterium]MDD3274343.1 CpaF family protein [Candidatus Omnitrophota bacterium]MDD5077472.1 CpaF family protein [Candidatus Omnitrophota bacterium]MDD5724933.1 CpaF family protein [Candidatus Omnitrophota bacterium]